MLGDWIDRLTQRLEQSGRRGKSLRRRRRGTWHTAPARQLRFEPLDDRALLAAIAAMVEDAVAGDGHNPVGASSFPSNLTDVNGTLYFQATDGRSGLELWRINAAGQAEMVEDEINPYSQGSHPVGLTDVNGTLYFWTQNLGLDSELWRINDAGRIERVEGDNCPAAVEPTLFRPPQIGTDGGNKHTRCKSSVMHDCFRTIVLPCWLIS